MILLPSSKHTLDHTLTPYFGRRYDLDILVYSGDDDSVCATIGTQSWIWDLGYAPSPEANWAQYTYHEQPVGYITKWPDQHLAFVTVHGAGHEVQYSIVQYSTE